MKFRHSRLIMGALAISFSISVFADDKKPDRGWHWYDLPPEQVAIIKEEIKREVKLQVYEELERREKEERPEPGSSAWISQKLPEFRSRAADNPTVENIRAVLYLNKILVQRGMMFAKRSEMVAQSDPFLESGFDSTSNIPQARVRRKLSEDRKDALITKMTAPDKVVLWTFITPDCSLCDLQVHTLSLLTKKFAMPVLFILVDGATPPEYPFDENTGLWESVTDTGQSDLFPLISFPTSYAFNAENNDYVLVGQGHMPISTMKDRLLMAADFAAWVDPKEVEATRFNPELIDFSKVDLEGAEVDISDPSEFVKYVSGQILKGSDDEQ